MTSTSSLTSVVIALGSNLGNRRYHLARAVHFLYTVIHPVRISSIRETEPVDAPAGSPRFLNMALLGYTSLPATELFGAMLAIEAKLGRTRRGVKNEPRVIDLDLILYGGHRMRSETLTLPHPRAASRAFVMDPLREIWPGGYRVPIALPESTETRALRTGFAFVSR